MNLDLSGAGKQTLYLQVYDYYKDMIISGKLPPDSKLPSIRQCANQLQLSRTTIETAYLCLAADGYIISKPQSGYFVTERTSNQNLKNISAANQQKQPAILYDFTSSNVDPESFDFNLWRRYIKSALRQDERMLSYGEPQGEYELREAICQYVINKRNAVCTPDTIVIGAGSQSLMHILCPLIQERKTIQFHDTHFLQGIAVFEDYHFKVVDREEEADILYMTPSHMTRLGGVMPVSERLQKLRQSIASNRLIIEDDYDNEFRYLNKPAPCLQGLAGGNHVVYTSTFSKLLLPSIRLSFMILPEELLPAYQARKQYYSQTASKAEQLALCQFLRDGHLEGQIRKLKRLYANKSKYLQIELRSVFGKKISVSMGESVFQLHVSFQSTLSTEEIVTRCLQHGIRLFPGADHAEQRPSVVLSCSEIPMEAFHDACILLKNLIFPA